MDDSIRKKALRQAAKVAFGTCIIGCGGTLGSGQDASTDAVNDTTKKSDAAQTDAATTEDASMDSPTLGDGALACTGPIDIDASSVDEQVFQCCLGVVEQITGDSGFMVVDAGEVLGDPSIDNCCKAIIAHVDNDTADYGAASPTFGTCCSALGYPQGPACTPWGPPTPPAMEIA